MFDHAKVKREREKRFRERFQNEQSSRWLASLSGINIGMDDSKDSISKEISKVCGV